MARSYLRVSICLTCAATLLAGALLAVAQDSGKTPSKANDAKLAEAASRPATAPAASTQPTDEARQLAQEVKDKGWIVFGSHSDKGDWDLFLMRPDGSELHNITNTPEWDEFAPRFSPDGKKLLYRRMPKGTGIIHDRWGFQGQVIIADADGGNPVEFGKMEEYPWACWGADGKTLSCLSLKGIEIVDIATKQVVRSIARQGIYQQLFMSPDGKWFCGTANVGGAQWNIVRMNIETGELNSVSTFRNCTPDWFPDSKHVIFSNRPDGQKGNGWTQLWQADADGTTRSMIFGEDGFEMYGGAMSPDGKYVLFTRCVHERGGIEKAGLPMSIMRLSDAPMIGGASPDLRKVHPNAKDGPYLNLPTGWEPHWTYADIGKPK